MEYIKQTTEQQQCHITLGAPGISGARGGREATRAAQLLSTTVNKHSVPGYCSRRGGVDGPAIRSSYVVGV